MLTTGLVTLKGRHVKVLKKGIFFQKRSPPGRQVVRNRTRTVDKELKIKEIKCTKTSFLGATHSTQNSKNFKTETNALRTFLRNICRNSGNSWISEQQTIRLKIPGGKSIGTEIPDKEIPKFFFEIPKIWVYVDSKDCPLFRKFLKMLFHSSLKISGTSNQSFGVAWKTLSRALLEASLCGLSLI